ncbi:hypothetical protein [Desulfosporosinus sp. OT]|uniref:hypothetical protein n=1 Tax=Desulfosporosinus sp. OT TaxID=913865 RepID=UPI0002D64846|nr:hypothetical protein [Desulfosporosinus sp. OT]
MRPVHELALAGQTNAQASLQTGCPPDEPSLAHWRLRTSDDHGWSSVPVAKDGEKGPCAQPCFPGRFREVWRAARLSRSLGLKQRLSWVDGVGFPTRVLSGMLIPLGY